MIKFRDNRTHVGLITEAVILFCLLYFLILSFIIPELYVVVEYLVSFLFLNLAFNNFYQNRKSKVGIAYLVCGIIILVATKMYNG